MLTPASRVFCLSARPVMLVENEMELNWAQNRSPKEILGILAGNKHAITGALGVALTSSVVELSRLQHRSAQEMPLPHPRGNEQHLLIKLTPHNDIEAYSSTFKKTAEQ